MNARSLGPPLARGRTANVYPWGAGSVLKLFHEGIDRTSIEYEARITCALRACGLAVPSVGELLSMGGQAGLVYERVDGPSMFESLQRKPWRLFAYARQLAQLQAQMHMAQVKADLLPQRQKLENKIHRAALPADVQIDALAALASMPEGAQLCHGDLHPANIIMAAQGAVVIDWTDASRGNPWADVARTTLIILGETHRDRLPNPLMKILVRVFHWIYLRAYIRLRSDDWEEYRYWLPIVAAARLSENICGSEAMADCPSCTLQADAVRTNWCKKRSCADKLW